MVDASIRCLQATGWVNFRMRAMLVTFASYALWLDWRPVAHFLARLFLSSPFEGPFVLVDSPLLELKSLRNDRGKFPLTFCLLP